MMHFLFFISSSWKCAFQQVLLRVFNFVFYFINIFKHCLVGSIILNSIVISCVIATLNFNYLENVSFLDKLKANLVTKQRNASTKITTLI